MSHSIGVLLTSHKRPHTLRLQLAAIDRQSVKADQLVIFHDDGGVQPDQEAMRGRKVIASNWNMGVWARFSAALYMLPCEFICIFDDDTIPGKDWIGHCLANWGAEKALYGSCGVTFPNIGRTPRDYTTTINRSTNPYSHRFEVDIIGHSWFIHRELLRHSLGLPSCANLGTAGEDYHISWAAQHKGLPCIVPGSSSETCCGSIQRELGTDDVALYRQPGEEEKKARAHQFYLDQGWKPLAMRKQDAIHA